MLRLSRVLLFTALALSACKDEGENNNNNNPADAGDNNNNSNNNTGNDGGGDSGTGPGTDAAAGDAADQTPDGAVADGSTAVVCSRDQDCASGQVCDVTTRACGPGKSCASDRDCELCFSLLEEPIDCGHGFHVTSYCSAERGNVCTRALSPCEPCATDRDCYQFHPELGAARPQKKCLAYDDGRKYCGRPPDGDPPCPAGFVLDAESNQCKRVGGCPADPPACPAGDPGQQCLGTEQICAGRTGGPSCADATTSCVTNDRPGELGLCMGFCRSAADCPASRPFCDPLNGLCSTGCTKDSCPSNKVCHPADGECRDACNANQNCVDRYGADTYCNMRSQTQAPTFFKNYHDEFSCVPLGCEDDRDCSAAGIVCDKSLSPPACVEGCKVKTDCLSGEICKGLGAGGRQPSYSRAECRALPNKGSDSDIGVCCNPGCTDRNLQCGFNEWCCGEPGSPYTDPSTCGDIPGVGRAEAGQCFPIVANGAFCANCEDGSPCDSGTFFGWNAGRNVDPAVNGGAAFKEQEFCYGVTDEIGLCGVTCNPDAANGDSGCPRDMACEPLFYSCMSDTDCGGLTCAGADPAMMRPGRCQCGEAGVQSANCPTQMPGSGVTVEHPRCVGQGGQGDLFCVAAYNCRPKPVRVINQQTMQTNYPMGCTDPDPPRDAGVGPSPDAGPRPDATVSQDAGPRPDATTTPDGGSSGTACSDLVHCCTSISDPENRSTCESIATAGPDSACSSTLLEYRQSGFCP